MITGIDETGDFDPNSDEYNYFTAIHIDQNVGNYLIKKSQFNIWEGSIPNEYKKQGEVKGTLLRDEHIISFYNEVIKTTPHILYSIISIIPSQNPIDLLEKHKQIEIQQIQKVIDAATANNHLTWADGYKQILYWYKNRNYQIQMKMKCLSELLSISLNTVLGWGQVSYIIDNDLSNLRDMRFLIDKDFVRAENAKILWGELFRQFWMEHSQRDPMPILNAWPKAEHPIYKVFDDMGNKLGTRKIFKSGTSFVDSSESWEVRMADLFGTILHRYNNRKRLEKIGIELMGTLNDKRRNYKHIGLARNI